MFAGYNAPGRRDARKVLKFNALPAPFRDDTFPDAT
jgi:hypothetical protein